MSFEGQLDDRDVNDDDGDSQVDEALPFAVPEPSPQHTTANTVFTSPEDACGKSSTFDALNSSSTTSSSCQPPQLASSLISNPDSLTTTSCDNRSLHTDSQLLDAGASVLQQSPSENVLHMSEISQQATTTTTITSLSSLQPGSECLAPSTFRDPNQSATLSELWCQADNRLPPSTTTPAADNDNNMSDQSSSALYQSSLSILPEEQTVASLEAGAGLSSYAEFPLGCSSLPPPPPPVTNFNATAGTDRSSLYQTIVSSAPPLSEERRGATAHLTGPGCFTVCVDLTGAGGSRDVMDILGDPDKLRMWYDPIFTLVVNDTSSQEDRLGDRSGRAVDGTWITATTNQLIIPSKTSLFYRTSRSVSALVGFPTYGKLNMFVERQRAQVSLQLGPFPGNVQVSHRLSVQDAGDSKIRIIDHVQLSVEQGSSDLCGIWGVLGKCFLPSTDNYMDQTLGSMARLRFLIERGEQESPFGGISSPLLTSQA